MTGFEKLYYSISEVSQQVDETINTLRYWEKEFDVLTPNKTVGGTRKYTPENIETIRIIKDLLRKQGLTIDGAKIKIAHDYSELKVRNEVKMRLKKIRSELVGIRRELNTVEPTSKDEIL